MESKIEFYWKIRTWDKDITYLIPINEAAKVNAQIERGDSHVKFRYRGREITLMKSDVREVSESDEVMKPEVEQAMLSAGDIDLVKKEPLINPLTGAVMWKWAKKHVPGKKWDNDYSARGSYYKLGNYYGGDRVWIAWKHILTTNQELPEDVEWCPEEEQVKLDKIYASKFSH